MPTQNDKCPICGETSAVHPKLVLIDAQWELAPGGDSAGRFLVNHGVNEVTQEQIQQRQVAHGFCCGHCEKEFARESALETARNRRLLNTKQGSWIALIRMVEEDFPEEHWAAWKAFILPLLRKCIATGLDQYFRVGQSMSHIIISTTEEHRLEQYKPSPLRITIRSEDKGVSWFIARSHGNLWFSKPEREEPVDSQTAFAVLKSSLTELWTETRPREALPEPLLPR